MEKVAALQMPDGKVDHIEWDDSLPGFGVRSRGKTKRWVVQYRAGKQQRRESIGDVRRVGLEAARKIARQRFAAAEMGGDPGAERTQARVAARALSLGDVVARYLAAKEDVLRPSTFKQAKMHFRVHWKPFLGLPIDSITRSHVAARLQDLIKEHGRTSAARARGNLSAVINWAAKAGLCLSESNPVLMTHDPVEGIQPRERVLTDRELRVVWQQSGDGPFGAIVKMLTLTGCRRDEIAGSNGRRLVSKPAF
jgi:hypothetical protein